MTDTPIFDAVQREQAGQQAREYVRAGLARYAVPSERRQPTDEEHHRDALMDTGEAYSAYKGWTLKCLWCDYETVGQTKAEARERIQAHYDRLLPEGAEIR